MKKEEREKIIEILRFHGGMIGTDYKQCEQLAIKMNLIRCSDKIESIECEILLEMERLCEVIGYDVSKENNKSREGMRVPMRDAVCKVVIDKFSYYSRLPHVLGGFFNKSSSTGHSMMTRGIAMHKNKDKLFMRYYDKCIAFIEEQDMDITQQAIDEVIETSVTVTDVSPNTFPSEIHLQCLTDEQLTVFMSDSVTN